MNEKLTIKHKGFTSYEKQYDIADRQFIKFSLFNHVNHALYSVYKFLL